ncbi:hypothetical protein [Rhizobium sp. NZLR4b]|uniref:hypothetical protein n=1 Tax=Rhizobium sp. NZLR4b TaxID=2731102 RepID=UPI001C831C26|nr:hypothetical protein [Rhizobium sp. NZLR4b]MBX5165456.1 hypothetical protein [Rhizobium sp. NZLR4b]
MNALIADEPFIAVGDLLLIPVAKNSTKADSGMSDVLASECPKATPRLRRHLMRLTAVDATLSSTLSPERIAFETKVE